MPRTDAIAPDVLLSRYITQRLTPLSASLAIYRESDGSALYVVKSMQRMYWTTERALDDSQQLVALVMANARDAGWRSAA